MKIVVLAEKPDQGKKFAEALGKSTNKGTHCLVNSDILQGEVVVTWGIGHLVGLDEPEAYNPNYKKWSMKALPILPEKMKYKVTQRTSKQFKSVKEILKTADSIIIATDPDREGENIAYSILMMCGKEVWNKPKKRLWVNSLQNKEIRRGFQQLKNSNETYNYYTEAQTRQTSDWLIGINYTRYMTLFMQQKGLKGVWSVGRVQTPTNTLIAQNYLERKNFKPQAYWQLLGLHKFASGQVKFKEDKKEARYFDKEEFNQLFVHYRLNEVKEATVTKVQKQQKSKKAPKLFSLGALQGYASSNFGWTASKTLKVMQTLYDAGIASYPRTSSSLITTNEFDYLKRNLEKYKSLMKLSFDNEHLEARKEYVDNAKVVEHYAIIPTEELPVLEKLSSDQMKLYTAIVKRTLQMFAADYEYEQTTVLVDVNGLVFKTIGLIPVKSGWKDILAEKTEEDNEESQTLPNYLEGMKIPFTILQEEKETTPPSQITEAQLVKENGLMKKLGLGTEATRSGIIETLKEKEYIKNDGKTKLLPTEKGLLLYDVTKDILVGSPEMTSKWEQYLVTIGQGKNQPEPFINKVKQSIPPTFDKIGGQAIAAQQVESVKSQNSIEIGEYIVVEKTKLYEVTKKGESESFAIWKNISGKKLTKKELEELLLHGKTKNKKKDLKSQKGKLYSAYLILNDKKIIFGFE